MTGRLSDTHLVRHDAYGIGAVGKFSTGLGIVISMLFSVADVDYRRNLPLRKVSLSMTTGPA
ncbi:MAG: hypothetical protein M3137_08445 [Actinomycetota bacterium]|nr:hypothetical protein [Actinomycetota bacterium]